MKKTILLATGAPLTVDVYTVAHCDKKSFYGKALIIETAAAYYLQSYKTVVCKVDKETKTFTRFWDEESATTTRHINGFLADMQLSGGGLAWWRKQEVKPADMVKNAIEYKYKYA